MTVMLQTATARIAITFSARTAWLTDGFYFDMIISADTQDTPVATHSDPCYQEDAQYGRKRYS
ncbi:MAG: hypothetical protein C4532_09310 [Candidatus Abyssobacteria bacterium SURF_17]|uniref:Uncharacterized protein n=1 Tax=Candidatus Abyssobacteria bacterium SURF_17 TaxID=2093361 RepID=A0A419EYT2_9BACT|nr:MAG: hypothetical protein C4532_09310 [Candidatus Abyssubacteria bacterium SURF_17]